MLLFLIRSQAHLLEFKGSARSQGSVQRGGRDGDNQVHGVGAIGQGFVDGFLAVVYIRESIEIVEEEI
jgi:hypothetical protein